MTDHSFDRRTLLRGALGVAAAAGAGGLLAGCGDGSTGGTPSNNANVKLPTYIEYKNVPTPDLAASSDGVLAGYLKYPANPPAMTDGKPGDGSTVSAFVETYSPIAPALSDNPYWQALNKALGVDLKMSVVSANDYQNKLTTLVAGNELPDVFQVKAAIADLPGFLDAKCQELSDFLAGDAVKEYPFLANIPAVYWKLSGGIVNGGLYGIPVPRSIMGGPMYYRADILSAKGIDPNPSSYAEFAKLCKELTDTRHNTWALSNADGALFFIQQMLGMPKGGTDANQFGWKYANGKLTNAMEMPEYKEALARTTELVKAGYAHPDGFASATTDLTTKYKQWFNAGSALLDQDNWTAWPQWYVQNVAGPKFRVEAMMPPDYDGSTAAVTWQGAPDFSYTVLKKASKARVKALLRVVNWLAAPFGSSEYLLRKYGVRNVDWTMQDGAPVQNTKGANEVPGLGVGYIVDAPQVLYYPGFAQATKDTHAFMQKFLPNSVSDPTLGLYSPTLSSKGGTLSNNVTDARHAIMQGRESVSSWDDTMKQWRADGGDAIRNEYEKVLKG